MNDEFNVVKNSRGFSLLEIMIAMAIIAIMVAVTFPNLGGTSNKLAKSETLRLVAALELVRDQSILLNQELGINIDEERYQFLRLNEESDDQAPFWEVISDIPELKEHQFPQGLDINVSIDGENLFSSNEDEVEIFEEDVDIFEDEEEDKKVDPPQIYFLSTGEQNKFSIGIAIAESLQKDEPEFFRVRGFLTGNLQYEGNLEGSLFQDLDREYQEER